MFNRQVCDDISSEIIDVLQKHFGEQMKISRPSGNYGTFSSYNCTLKLNLDLPQPNGVVKRRMIMDTSVQQVMFGYTQCPACGCKFDERHHDCFDVSFNECPHCGKLFTVPENENRPIQTDLSTGSVQFLEYIEDSSINP